MLRRISKRSTVRTPSMPAGAIGIWFGTDYVASPRKTIPNSAKLGQIDPSLLSTPRGEYSTTRCYANTGLTITDSNAVAPDGTTTASTMTNAGSNWALYAGPTAGIVLPNGTYTICVSMRWKGTGSASFQMGDPFIAGGSLATKTATGSWGRFSQTMTLASGTLHPWLNSPDGTSAANFEICDFQLYAGSADLNPNWATALPLVMQNSDWLVGQTHGDTSSVMTANAFTHGGIGYIPFPSAVSLAKFTCIYVVDKKTNGTSPDYQPLFVKSQALYNDLTIGIGTNNFLGTRYGSTNIDFNGLNPSMGSGSGPGGSWGNTAGGRFVMGNTYDGATSTVWLNGNQVWKNSVSVSAPSAMTGLHVGVIPSFSIFSGYDISAMAYYPRILTPKEMFDAYNFIIRKLGMAQAQAPNRVLHNMGTSITAGQGTNEPVHSIYGANSSPTSYGFGNGLVGYTLALWNANTAVIDNNIQYPQFTSRKNILSVEIGANDLGLGNTYAGNPNGFTTALATFLDARIAAGWTVVVHTILPRTDGADSGAQFNTDRATANTTIKTWVGTHCHAVVDWASDATVGVDAAPNNSTYWQADKVHPKVATNIILEPYDRAVLNGLW